MTFRILRQARKEAVQAAAWYDHQRPGLGDDLLKEVARALARIEKTPHAFPRWDAYAGSREVRCCRLVQFPYVLIFACLGDDAVVIATSHERRHPLYWLPRLE